MKNPWVCGLCGASFFHEKTRANLPPPYRPVGMIPHHSTRYIDLYFNSMRFYLMTAEPSRSPACLARFVRLSLLVTCNSFIIPLLCRTVYCGALRKSEKWLHVHFQMLVRMPDITAMTSTVFHSQTLPLNSSKM